MDLPTQSSGSRTESTGFARKDLQLDASGCYTWCSCHSRCRACADATADAAFNRYDGRAVLEVLSDFADDKPLPGIAFAVGELLLAGMCDLPRTRAQVLEWLGERWRAGSLVR